MFFRRISKQLKRQDWLAIGIDFVIVVVGVYLGIQVDNWNEARADRERAIVYAERLRADLETDIARADARYRFMSDVAAYGRESLTWAESGAPGDGGWQILLAFFQASQVAPFRQVNATFEEMRSAGELSLIADPALRGALAEYYLVGTGSTSDYVLRLIPEYRQTVRSLIPSHVTRYIWEACHDEYGYDDQRLVDCPAPIGEDEIALILADIAAAPDVLPQLRFWISTLDTARKMLNLNVAAARDLVSRLEASGQRR